MKKIIFLFLFCAIFLAAFHLFSPASRILFREPSLTIQTPAAPLGSGALEMSGQGQSAAFYRSLYRVTRATMAFWQKQALANDSYYIERREKNRVNRQLIPYPSKVVKGQVLWNLTVPSLLAYASHSVLGDEEALKRALSQPASPPLRSASTGQDPFCNKTQLAKQQILETKRVRVLYNYKPISKYDLLVISKVHAETTANLDEESFVEAMLVGDAIAAHFQKKGYPIVYLTQANGKGAGQTVDHWHLHVYVASGQGEALLGKFRILQKMMGLMKPLSDQELAKRIAELKVELSFLFIPPLL